MVEKIKALPNTGFAPNNKAIAAHLRQQAEWIEAKIEALEEAAVIAQTNSDSNVDGGDYACGCCYEIRRMAADVKGK